jgi:hypothetical protein
VMDAIERAVPTPQVEVIVQGRTELCGRLGDEVDQAAL